MKKPLLLSLLLSLAGLMGLKVRADSTWMYAVQISATVQASPPRVTLAWPQDPNGANSYTVYRKGKTETSWGWGTTLSGSTLTYVDNNVGLGGDYEYAIVKSATLGYAGYGYIYVGINAPLTESRGKVVLVVDNSFSTPLAGELARLQSDLVGDGWTVLRHEVSRSDTPDSVRNLVRGDYNSDPQKVKAVFLFGHVPILRCGNLNVDGHQARPMPADAFYGDMDGWWGDSSYLPSDVELMVGRVDFFNMPGSYANSPWPSEQEMLRSYLNKDHRWRHKLLTVPCRGLVGNRFGDFNGEGFAASGFRNFEPFVGPGNIVIANEQDWAPAEQKWSSILAGGTYLWAYGCGGGSYTSMSGMGTHGQYGDVTSYDIVGQDAKAVFYMMFGSWLGEWDSADNIMRSVLATSMGLSCSWAGRPHWFYHHMGLGEVIGYSARLTMNNENLYHNQVNQQTRGVHIALMGDPTLRMHPVSPPGNLTGSLGAYGASLSWSASSDSNLQGYHIYRSSSPAGPFTRVCSSLVSGTGFTDTGVTSGTYTYMVRAVKLESTPSGTYYNPSQGAFVNLNGTGSSLPVVSVAAADANAAEAGPDPGTFVVSRTGSTSSPLTVNFTLSGMAINGTDYTWLETSVNIPAGAASATVPAIPIDDTLGEGAETVTLTLNAGSSYTVGSPGTAKVTIFDNDGSTDTQAPTVAITAPATGNTISGMITIAANATDNVHVSGVQFKLHGTDLGPEIWVPPFQVRWDTTTVSDGVHGLYAVARDSTGNCSTSAVVRVTVKNTTITRDSLAPRTSITVPANGATISGKVICSADASDNVHVSGVQFKLHGTDLGPEIWAPPFQMTWNTTTVSDGVHGLYAVARDSTGNRSTSAVVRVTIKNTAITEDSLAPRISITAPANEATISGIVVCSANATDNVHVSGVQFKLHGTDLGPEIWVPPFQMTWNTTTVSDGVHGLYAVARDSTGNRSTSAVVRVTVKNTTKKATTPPASTGNFVWVDDTVPYGSSKSASGGDRWYWVSNNPAPYSGKRAHQSRGSGNLEHLFQNASVTMSIHPGDVLYCYIYMNLNNPPKEVMLHWTDGSWEHRAYWGANLINMYGMNDTAGRRYMGPLPPLGRWVRLEVPAGEVALEGSTVSGMCFSIYDGQATWDRAGKMSWQAYTNSTTTRLPLPGDVVWVDDTLPGGATGMGNGEPWTWITSNPKPFSGMKAHRSPLHAGLHEHYFSWAADTLNSSAGDTLFAYIYIDPSNLPKEIMLHWNVDGDWEHRAYWGANKINCGTDGTASRRYMGPLPASGKWVRLEVPARQVNLEGLSAQGMAFSLYGGQATWDCAGRSALRRQ